MLHVIGRLKPGIAPARAQAELQTILRPLESNGTSPGNLEIAAIPLRDVLVGASRSSLLIFLGAVAFVLLIACANVANLLLMRGAARRQEIAVRVSLGAGRARLVGQLLTESVVLSFAGGALGMLLAIWAVPALLALAPAGTLPRAAEIHVDAAMLVFTMGLSLLTGLVFGLAPAIQATQRDLRVALAPGGRASTGQGLRGALVVAEMAFALILLAGAGLLVKSFLHLQAINPGFHPEHLLTVTVDLPRSTYQTPAILRDFHQRMLSKLSEVPGVSVAAAVNFLPLGDSLAVGTFEMEGGRKRPRGFLAAKPTISPGYFRAMGIRLIGGREFTERDDSSAPGVIIISQTVARRLWPGENPLGRRLSMDDHPKPGDWLTIVGVVDDIHQQDLKKSANPAIYQPYAQVSSVGFLNHMTFVVRTLGNPSELASVVRRALREVDPNIPAQSLATMQALVSESTAEPLFQTRLLAVFSLMALALAAFGIYAVLAYSVEQRKREIGIRMALGAAAGDVTRLVLRRAAALISLGLLTGALGALAVTRVLSAFLFEVQPTDGVTGASVALLLAAVALLAGWLPAHRAAHLDPLVALRHE
jgi:putative ABC transport system permease protein